MYIQRTIEKKINSYLKDKEIIGIIGPRQAGKTTLINRILDNIKNKKINRITFENLSLARLFDENIEAFIESEITGNDILFIDEFQYVKNGGQKLKYIFDTIPNIKIIISGSSATELSIQSIKYLVGRIIVFNLFTLSFEEYLEYKNEKLFNICKKQLFSNEIYNQLKKYLEEYILFGGYPRVVLEKDLIKKKEILKNIFNTYLLKEISEILKYKESRIIETTVKFLSSQIGGVLNYDDLSGKVGVSVYEIKNILNILDKTFISTLALNFHTNKQTELIKSPKIFFYDLGFRNVVINLFEKDLITGEMYENFIASELIRKNMDLRYWRTKSGAEVDFIYEKANQTIPIEIKSYLKSDNVEKSFRSFITKYSPKIGFILSTNYNNERKIENTNIYFLNYIEFIFKNLNEI